MIRHQVQRSGLVMGADMKICALSAIGLFALTAIATGGSPIAFVLGGIGGIAIGLTVTQREPDAMRLLGLSRWRVKNPDRDGKCLWFRP